MNLTVIWGLGALKQIRLAMLIDLQKFLVLWHFLVTEAWNQILFTLRTMDLCNYQIVAQTWISKRIVISMLFRFFHIECMLVLIKKHFLSCNSKVFVCNNILSIIYRIKEVLHFFNMFFFNSYFIYFSFYLTHFVLGLNLILFIDKFLMF